MNSRIQVLTSSGEAVRSFGRRGLFVGNLPRPKGVAVDQNGLIYVVESYYDYLLIFNNKGELMLPIGGSGSGVGQFYLPSAVWVGNQQRIYVSDMFNGRIAVFEFLGEG
jgi:DNA-binding beta-propeller fold protein YncE